MYVFNGNRDGVSRRYSQRLIGTRFSPTMRGFGISISEPRDVDRDNYSDVAVGAYLSGEVVLLRSAPVVAVNVTLTYPQVRLLRNSTSFLIDIWMSYEGAYVPQYLRNFIFYMSYIFYTHYIFICYIYHLFISIIITYFYYSLFIYLFLLFIYYIYYYFIFVFIIIYYYIIYYLFYYTGCPIIFYTPKVCR